MPGPALRGRWSCRRNAVLGRLWSSIVAGAFLLRHGNAGYDDESWSYPVAAHRLIVAQPGEIVVIKLPGYIMTGDQVKATITGLPSRGALFQLSKVFNDYGYEPKVGEKILAAGTEVTGSDYRLIYKAPVMQAAPFGKWDSFAYTVSSPRLTSAPGTVTIVPPNGVTVGSDFVGDVDGWTVVGNRQPSLNAVYDPTSRGLQSRYVYGNDDIINVDPEGRDQNLWYFKAPLKFLGNQGIAYGGTLSFTLSSFSGDFSTGNLNNQAYVVLLECSGCNSNAGVRLGMPLSKLQQPFTGSDLRVSLALKEKAGWVQDSKNTLKAWATPSRCTFIQVLSGLTGVRILGDFTRWYESVSLDNVAFVQRQGQLPMCAQGAPDAYKCTCSG